MGPFPAMKILPAIGVMYAVMLLCWGWTGSAAAAEAGKGSDKKKKKKKKGGDDWDEEWG